ncbi:hypothetical protein K1719_047033 [Acacia pycnantha]|nr:hypothetical protein K1719_047033 [Acacia pycnantha]
MMEEEGEDGARRKRKVRFDTANFTGVESHAYKDLLVGMVEGQEEDSTEDFGVVQNLKGRYGRGKGVLMSLIYKSDFYPGEISASEDYMEALTGGPWVINDAYLNVSCWRPDFNPKNERIASVVAWAIKLDIHTAQMSSGCGVFGHTRESCEQLQRRKNEARMDVEEVRRRKRLKRSMLSKEINGKLYRGIGDRGSLMSLQNFNKVDQDSRS